MPLNHLKPLTNTDVRANKERLGGYPDPTLEFAVEVVAQRLNRAALSYISDLRLTLTTSMYGPERYELICRYVVSIPNDPQRRQLPREYRVGMNTLPMLECYTHSDGRHEILPEPLRQMAEALARELQTDVAGCLADLLWGIDHG